MPDPAANAGEAELVDGMEVCAAGCLAEVVRWHGGVRDGVPEEIRLVVGALVEDHAAAHQPDRGGEYLVAPALARRGDVGQRDLRHHQQPADA